MNKRIDFYHLNERSMPLDQAFVLLSKKALGGGKRLMVQAGSQISLKQLEASLWTLDPESWLPNGLSTDPYPEEQPILLTTEEENKNKSAFLFLVDGAWNSGFPDFERVFILFDERDDVALNAARSRWKSLRDDGCPLYYWQQNDRGRWEEKASANTAAKE